MIFIFVPLLSLLSCPFTGVGMLQGLCIFVVEEGASLYWLPVNLFSAISVSGLGVVMHQLLRTRIVIYFCNVIPLWFHSAHLFISMLNIY
ncbi:hypothetical protein Peur_010172 [Populus x canadensis]